MCASWAERNRHPCLWSLISPLLSLWAQWIGQAWLNEYTQCQSTTCQSSTRAFLLTPVPYPSPLFIMHKVAFDSDCHWICKTEGILKALWKQRDKHCLMNYLYYLIVFYSIHTSFRSIIQRIRVTGDTLWNINKLGYPHSCLLFYWLPSCSEVSL